MQSLPCPVQPRGVESFPEMLIYHSNFSNEKLKQYFRRLRCYLYHLRAPTQDPKPKPHAHILFTHHFPLITFIYLVYM